MEIAQTTNGRHDLQFGSLIHLLSMRAEQDPSAQVYTFLEDGEKQEVHITYQQLDHRARVIAAHLQHFQVEKEPVLLLYPPGLDYISGFFGCLYAGAIAVPSYPPRRNRPDKRLEAIVVDTQARIALTTSDIETSVERRLAEMPVLGSMKWLATDKLDSAPIDSWQQPDVDRNSLAMLQYTSGSTGKPKGVILTHDNLLSNLSLIQQGLGLTAKSQGVIWLPPYHDMGLIGGILQPLYANFSVVLMSPFAFLQRPFRWLKAVTYYGGTVSGGPNFAYDFCVEKITPEERDTLDLSHWDVAFTGAEPIHEITLERFAAYFEPCGFHYDAFYPCYGLAEATLIVSGGRKEFPPVTKGFDASTLKKRRAVSASKNDIVRTLVSCGTSFPKQKIIIVHPETGRLCPPNEVGEIWVAGPSVAKGYWHKPGVSQETFQARLAGTDEINFLRTGDLGFLHEGELYVTGRIKDLIIIRGRNYYPQDIERTVEKSHATLQTAACAAFSVTVDHQEQLIIAQELQRQHRKADIDIVSAAIRKEVAHAHELQIQTIVFLQPMSIPRTSSGKIQRYLCREGYLNNSLRSIAVGQRQVSKGDEAATLPSNRFVLRSLHAISEPAARRSILFLYLQDCTAKVIDSSPSHIDPRKSFADIGLQLSDWIALQREIETNLQIDWPPEIALTSSIQEAVEPILMCFVQSTVVVEE